MTAVFICQHCTGHLFGHAPGCPVSKAMIEWRASALAAHPSPDTLDVERLAALIREVDGNHDLGAAALAEAILARLENQ